MPGGVPKENHANFKRNWIYRMQFWRGVKNLKNWEKSTYPGFNKNACKRTRVSKKGLQTYQGFQKGHASVPRFPKRVSKKGKQTYQGFRRGHANVAGFPKKACKRTRVSKRDMLTYQGFQKHACKRTQVSKRGMQTRQGFQKPRQTMLRSTMADLKLSSLRNFFCRCNAQNQRQKKSSSAWSWCQNFSGSFSSGGSDASQTFQSGQIVLAM